MASSDYVSTILKQDDSLEDWDSFVDESPQGSIFCRSWWMKAVCRDGFYILVVRKSGRIVAGLPLPFSRNLGLTRVTMPELTQTMGVLLLPTTKKTYEGRLSEEMQIMDAIIEAIPRFNHFSLAFR